MAATAAPAPTIEQQDDQAAAPEHSEDGAAEETEIVAESAVQAAAPPVAAARLSEGPQTKAARAGPVRADIAAAPGAQAVTEPIAQMTEEVPVPAANGVSLPLWQLEVASGVVLVTLLTATIWTSLRRHRRFG